MKWNKRVILAKVETTYAVDPTPTGAANAILIRNLSVAPLESEYADRDLVRPYFGNSEQLPVAVNSTCEFEVEIAGAGAAGTAPAYGPLLRGCGMSETLTAAVKSEYKPITDAQESVTIYYNEDGRLHKLTGARGNVSLEFNAKGIPVYKFKFWGLYQAIADAAAPAATFTGFIKPLPVNKVNTPTFALHSFAAVAQSLSIDLGNQVVFRSLVGAETVQITDRQSTGQISIEDTLVAAKDWWTIIRNATLGSLSLIHGVTAGNIVEIPSANVQLTAPNLSESDNIAMLGLSMNFIPSSAGNDEFSVIVR